MGKREIAQMSGYVAWYARSVKGLLPTFMFTLFHMLSTLFVGTLVLIVLAPSDFSYTVNTSLQVLPIFILLSFMGAPINS
ncbi:MAG: hypothetical protein ACW98J_04730 [Candidatus Thorarchaeota archaeon]|jgi:hypothetical protein